MKLARTLVAVALMALTILALATPAGAQAVDECQARFADLRAATVAATLVGQNAEKDQAGLLGKLDNADAALAAGKPADAARKLTDFRTKVETLSAQGKLDAGDAAALIAGANEAIACVQGLMPAPATS